MRYRETERVPPQWQDLGLWDFIERGLRQLEEYLYNYMLFEIYWELRERPDCENPQQEVENGGH